jgi:Tol biopolymer transport system component
MTTRHLLALAAALAATLVLAPAAVAAFPGKNGLIAFEKSKGAIPDIWVLDPKTRRQTDLTRTPQVYEHEAAFSPDGKTIAFSWQDFRSDTYGIGVVRADGKGMRHLTTGDSDHFMSQPAWTADGKTIVFTKRFDPNSGQSIFGVSPNGGAQRQISFGGNPDGEADLFPLGSPIGSSMAFLHHSLGAPAVEQIAPVGGGPATPAGQHAASDWSPDGKRFVYESTHGIYSSAIDGTGELKLADLPTKDMEPSYSPDGRLVVWTNENTHDLWMVAAGGGTPKNLTHQAGFEHGPSWGRAVKTRKRHRG